MKPFTPCLILLSITVLFSACESHEQSADYAFEQVKKEKALHPEDSVLMDKEHKEQIAEIKAAIPIDDWKLFKREVNKKIVANEHRIKELKSTPNLDSKTMRKVTDLEKDNQDLRRQMDEYTEEAKQKWEDFKTKLNLNENGISMELKALKMKTK